MGSTTDPGVLAEIWSKLSYAGRPPYYLFQGRPTAGNARYEVPLVRGGRIFQQALAAGFGLARRAKYAMSHASGKIEIVAVDPEPHICAITRPRSTATSGASSSPSATMRPDGSTICAGGTGRPRWRPARSDPVWPRRSLRRGVRP